MVYMLATVLGKGKPLLLSLRPSFALTVRLTEIRLLRLLVVVHLLKNYSPLLFMVVLQHTAVGPPLTSPLYLTEHCCQHLVQRSVAQGSGPQLSTDGPFILLMSPTQSSSWVYRHPCPKGCRL